MLSSSDLGLHGIVIRITRLVGASPSPSVKSRIIPRPDKAPGLLGSHAPVTIRPEIKESHAARDYLSTGNPVRRDRGVARRRVRSGGVDTGGSARVIVQMAPGHASSELNPVVAALGGTIGRTLDIINASVVELPARAIPTLAGHPLVARVSSDRAVAGTMERTSATIGATAIHDGLGYDGLGVGGNHRLRRDAVA